MAIAAKPVEYGVENIMKIYRFKLDSHKQPLKVPEVRIRRIETPKNSYSDVLVRIEDAKTIRMQDIAGINGKLPARLDESLSIRLKDGRSVISLIDAFVSTSKTIEEKPRGTVETIHQWSLNKMNLSGDFTLIRKMAEVYKYLLSVANDFQVFNAVKK